MTVSEEPGPGPAAVTDLDADAVAALPDTVFATAVRRALADRLDGEPRACFVMHDRVML